MKVQCDIAVPIVACLLSLCVVATTAAAVVTSPETARYALAW